MFCRLVLRVEVVFNNTTIGRVVEGTGGRHGNIHRNPGRIPGRTRKEFGVDLGDHLLGVQNRRLLARPAGLLLPLTTLPPVPQNIKTDSLPLCRGDLSEKLFLVVGGGC